MRKPNIYDIVEEYVVERYGDEKLPEVYMIIVDFLESLVEGDLDEIKERLEKLWEMK